MSRIRYYVFVCIVFISCLARAQEQEAKLALTLDDVIRLANDSSLNAFIAQNSYFGEYWDYKYFTSQRRPFLEMTANPIDFSRRYSQEYNFQDSSYYYVEQQTFGSSGNLSLTQNIMKTGGRFYVDTDLGYLNNLNQPGVNQFSSTPVRIGFRQQLFGFNRYKWLSKTAPLEYEAAKKKLIQDMENVSLLAVNSFFTLSSAQINHEIARTSLANADTLYNIGMKRFELAKISQEELFTLKLAVVNARNDYDRSKTTLKRAQMRLNSLLRLDNSVKIKPVLPEELPDLQLKPELCLELAMKNNPEVFNRKVRQLQSARSVDLAKKNSRMKADLNASFGLNQRGSDLPSAYRNPSDQELVGVSLRIPILDWGLSESEYKLAQMQKRVIDAQLQQEEIDFRESVILTVEEFNLQKQLVEGAMEADTIANAVYDITRRRYMNGQSDIIRLSTNQRASINARRAYIQALESYWSYYYNIRSITLYDFEAGKDIEEEFEDVVIM